MSEHSDSYVVPLTDALLRANRVERGGGHCPARFQGFCCTRVLGHRDAHVAGLTNYDAVLAWQDVDPDFDVDEGL